jgi:hypothetical protein
MMTDLDRMAKADEKPAEVRLFVQKIGGKQAVPHIDGEPYKKIGRGKAPGYNVYEDITETAPEQVAKVRAWFAKRAKSFLGGSS